MNPLSTGGTDSNQQVRRRKEQEACKENHNRQLPPQRRRSHITRNETFYVATVATVCVIVLRNWSIMSRRLSSSPVFSPNQSAFELPYNEAQPAVPSSESTIFLRRLYPRTIGLHEVNQTSVWRVAERTERKLNVSRQEIRMANRLLDDTRYDNPKSRRADLRADGCEPLRSWQEKSFPTCNVVHEVDRTVEPWASGERGFLSEGGVNTVFAVREGYDRQARPFVMKTISYDEADADDITLAAVQMDALVMERATASPYIIDIFSYCGLTTHVQAGDTIFGTVIFRSKNVTLEDKLRFSVQVASALSDLENIDGDGVTSYVHQDYMVRQHLMVDGIVKLGDFNKGRFITRQTSSGELCPFKGFGQDSDWRAPEEYRTRKPRLTPKAQVFSLGNILQSILTGERLWEGHDPQAAKDSIASGVRFPFPKRIEASANPIDVVMKRALDMSFALDPKNRSSGMQVAGFLGEEAKRLSVDISKRWCCVVPTWQKRLSPQ